MSIAYRMTPKAGSSGKAPSSRKLRLFAEEPPKKLLILDQDLIHDLIEERQRHGIDQCDEVWEGVYIVPPLATNQHQSLVAGLTAILFNVVTLEKRGLVFPGANVSDRRLGWNKNFRAPDVVVALNDSKAIDCDTHWLYGPDFLVEVQSPGDQTAQKIPFYEQMMVRELLIVQRDTRALRLLRHDGKRLLAVEPLGSKAGKWLASAVVSLAFRSKRQRRGAIIEVQRTDDTPGNWTV